MFWYHLADEEFAVVLLGVALAPVLFDVAVQHFVDPVQPNRLESQQVMDPAPRKIARPNSPSIHPP